MPDDTQHPASRVLAQLDLIIHNMDTPGQEAEVQRLLDDLPSIRAATILQRGVSLSYNPAGISKEQICATLHHAGYRAAVFQDSKSGRIGGQLSVMSSHTPEPPAT